ncbi:MAG TPA: SDR family NAD(P)-dependent oxidoreductase [Pseudomonadales bacterium]
MTANPPRPLAGKRIVITGASMGIGQAVAVRLAQEGAQLVVNARGAAALDDTLAKITAAGGEAVASCGSVADFDLAGELIQRCIDHYGGLDVLINCAGIAEPHGSSILDIAPADWQQLIDVHLTGTFNTCRHAAPIMATQQHGAIINTGSHAFLGMYGGTGYAAGKGGTVSLSMAMAMDLKEHHVSVNVVCPGAKTRLSSGDDYQQLIENLNQRGLLSDDLKAMSLNPPDPAYVAPLYAYLASDAGRAISGRTFWAAGGYLGQFHKNGDQLLGFKNHDVQPPWTLDEIDRQLAGPSLRRPDEIFQVLGTIGALRLAVRQQLLVKLGNSKLAQWWMNRDKPAA